MSLSIGIHAELEVKEKGGIGPFATGHDVPAWCVRHLVPLGFPAGRLYHIASHLPIRPVNLGYRALHGLPVDFHPELAELDVARLYRPIPREGRAVVDEGVARSDPCSFD